MKYAIVDIGRVRDIFIEIMNKWSGGRQVVKTIIKVVVTVDIKEMIRTFLSIE